MNNGERITVAMNERISHIALDHLIEGLFVLDFEWRYLYVNDAALQQLKLESNQALGRSVLEIFPDFTKNPSFPVLERCLKKKESATCEIQLNFPDGTMGWFELRVQPVPEGMLLFSVDISEQKVAELRLKKLSDQFEEVIQRRTIQLESRNRELLESLGYARGIQNAFLPQKEGLTKLFPDSFVIHKPKDIVSGDFYWYKNTKEKIMLAAADCTGHGIPGALLSMIGIEKLNTAVSKSSDPATVLNHLNSGITSAMQHCTKYSYSQDGMDIAICAVDKAQRTVEFAGANRPLWLMRRQKNELEIYPATRLSIGSKIKKGVAFKNQKFRYEKGDTFYIFSDGYPDTFNGISGKKLTTKRFRDLLLEIQKESMQDQKKLLVSFIDDWKSNGEQVDDILVMGVRM